MIRQQEEKRKEALDRMIERKDVEKERELLAVREEYRAKLREIYALMDHLREQNEQKIRELQQPK